MFDLYHYQLKNAGTYRLLLLLVCLLDFKCTIKNHPSFYLDKKNQVYP
jgi:hypothetical protein